MGEGCTYHGGLPSGLGGELLTRSLSYDTREQMSICCGKCCEVIESTDLRWTCGRFAINDDDDDDDEVTRH